MTRFLLRHLPTLFAVAAAGLVLSGLIMGGCAPGLPEPESPDALLYVRYCSSAGCHGAIPPQGGSKGYWKMQYPRMLQTMETAGHPLPNADEDRKIRAYLARFAS